MQPSSSWSANSPGKLSSNGMQELTSDCDEYDFESDPSLRDHLALLKPSEDMSYNTFKLEEIRTAPLFSMSVQHHIIKCTAGQTNPFPQYGLLAGRLNSSSEQAFQSATDDGEPISRAVRDPRIFLNVGAPWSGFICGSQGSGLVFHYDSFTSAVGGQACEAAYLCSSGLEVNVLVSPSNLTRMKSLYGNILGPAANGPKVEPLLLHQQYLNVERLLTLMAVGNTEGHVPLYMQVVLQILREMAREPGTRPGIDYRDFKMRVLAKDLTSGQLGPLKLRLDLLESFIAAPNLDSKKGIEGNDWTSSPGKLTIVDLSCPFVDADTACALFDMCLGVFLEQKMDTGRIIALDEAHKYMRESTTAQKLTDSLVTAVRLQRHLACRVVIATQEPTISPKLLDLCSFTLVHRFTSPDWLKTLKSHLTIASMETQARTSNEVLQQTFAQIINLNVGEALLFAPSAILDVEKATNQDGTTTWKPKKLGVSCLKVGIRDRLTFDGGKSILAV